MIKTIYMVSFFPLRSVLLKEAAISYLTWVDSTKNAPIANDLIFLVLNLDMAISSLSKIERNWPDQ